MRYVKRRRKRRTHARECAYCCAEATMCEDCAEERLDDGLPDAAVIDFARAYLDMRTGRHKDAMDRLERALDDVAPQWRGLH